jgi:hypothetical protein
MKDVSGIENSCEVRFCETYELYKQFTEILKVKYLIFQLTLIGLFRRYWLCLMPKMTGDPQINISYSTGVRTLFEYLR